MPDILLLVLTFAVGVLTGVAATVLGVVGQILAVPVLVFALGLAPHLAVAASALGLLSRAAVAPSQLSLRSSRLALSLASIGGAIIGAMAAVALSERELLVLFGMSLLAIGIGALRHPAAEPEHASSTPATVFRLITAGLLVGFIIGVSGISAGAVILPAMVFGSLATAPGDEGAVTGFALAGLATALTYAAADFVVWPIALAFALGALAGALVGARLTPILQAHVARWREVLIWGAIPLGFAMILLNAKQLDLL